MLLTYKNPLDQRDYDWEIKELNVNDKFDTFVLKQFVCDEEITKELNSLLIILDCTKILSCGRNCKINSTKYTNYTSRYIFYLNQIADNNIRKQYLEHLRELHVKNVVFEIENPTIDAPKPTKSKSKPKKKKNKGLFIKAQSNDLFSGKPIYHYMNSVTGEDIVSDNPNLLDELNKTKTVKKQKKNKGVDLSLMTFSFKKK